MCDKWKNRPLMLLIFLEEGKMQKSIPISLNSEQIKEEMLHIALIGVDMRPKSRIFTS